MTAELEHAEQVMLAHEKPHSDRHKHHKDKASDAHEKYSSLYSSFDELAKHQDLPPGPKKVLCVAQDIWRTVVRNEC